MRAPARQAHRSEPVEVERARVGYGAETGARQSIPAFLQILAGDDRLLVPAFHEAGLFETRHHLIEGGTAVADADRRQQRAELTAGLLVDGEGLEHQELQMRDGR